MWIRRLRLNSRANFATLSSAVLVVGFNQQPLDRVNIRRRAGTIPQREIWTCQCSGDNLFARSRRQSCCQHRCTCIAQSLPPSALMTAIGAALSSWAPGLRKPAPAGSRAERMRASRTFSPSIRLESASPLVPISGRRRGLIVSSDQEGTA